MLLDTQNPLSIYAFGDQHAAHAPIADLRNIDFPRQCITINTWKIECFSREEK